MTRSPGVLAEGARIWGRSALDVGFEPEVNVELRCCLVVPQLQLALALAGVCSLGTLGAG